MTRLAPLLPPLMTVAAVLVAVTAAAGSGDAALDGRLFNLVPRPRLQELTLADLDATLDVLTDLLEERTLPSGGKGFVSRMAAPTLYSDSALCQRHTQIYWEQFSTGAPTGWPQLMFDASGKLPDGILVGNLNVFGSRDECFLVKASLDNDTYPDLDDQELQFTGRYVPVTVAPAPVSSVGDEEVGRWRQEKDDGLGTIFILPTLGIPTGVIGLCVPSSCSSADVQTGLQSMLGDNVTVVAFTSEVADQTVDLQPADIVVITLLALVGVLLLVGTALDVWLGYRAERQADKLRMTSVVDSPNSRLPQMLHVVEPKPATMQQRKPPALATWQRVLVAFSLYTNTKKLLDTSTSKGTLRCIHGIRFFSMTWVLMGHATLQLLSYDQNISVALDWIRTVAFQVVVNASPSVDTFYLLSGVVLAYSFCGTYEKRRKFNIFMFYLHRYLRLTPPLAIMIAVTATIFVYFGNGPLWARTAELQQDLCQTDWWRNLLYIQNYTPIKDECLAQTWYLATDMQMFLFSPVVLLPLVWKPLWGALWLGLLTVVFLALRISIWSVKNLPPTGLMLNVPDPVAAEELGDQYAYTWMRCTVWLTGIGLGYLLHRLRGRQITLKPWLWLSGWVAAFAIGISVIFGMTGYQMPWQQFSKAVAVSYGGLNRTAWGVAVGWVIFACVTGYGGPINTFLSYPGFIPLSRLTYAGYLIHINVLLLVEGSVKSTVYLDSYRYTYRLLAHVIVTFAAAMLLSLTFEVPFINLEKIMFEPKKPAVSLGGPAVAASEPKADGSEVEGTGLETDKEAGPSIKE
ncbi:nose resistant to fluoxetine protein 6-like [Amphibalanus amphitrite]|uniref:nose resistant to fluoxetine protein 6-like n=1 Tax=Amphibalanus amphitrite TaxID=1232801 RepID=UPI001C903F4A|nr:nose resistant to fluoxetine protein 6-like [Amphibalanus amphitrite]